MTTNNLILRIILGVGIILLVVFSALPMIPPRAVPADAPAASFSSGRAMADLRVVARQPHAAGSDAQAQVRAYIVEQIETLGLKADIQVRGQVSNILVNLPGTDPTQTVLVTGHYDSHPPAPGAGDDGLSTVAMLESIRALHASPPLRNDILFLFTDGEELGWLGASAYLSANRKAKDEIGVVLCFDGLPGNGPLILIETSPGDAWLVKEMSGLPLSLYAGSWTNRVERGEIDTDCSIFAQKGFTSIEIENAESGTRYHTTRDTVEAISPHLVQGFGRTMLGLTRHFGSLDLRNSKASSDLAYFTVPLVGLISYPAWVVPMLNGLGVLALLVFVVVALRRGSFSFGRFGLSLLGLLCGIVLFVLVAQLAWGAIKNSYAPHFVAGVGFEASTAWLTGMIFAATIWMIILLVVLSRRLGALNLLPAAILLYVLVWLIVSQSMDADNPLTTAYIALPFLGGVAGMGVLLFTKNPVWKVVFLAVCALVILVLQVPQLWLARYTREDAWIPVLAACIPMGFFAAQVEAIFGRTVQQKGSVQRSIEKGIR